MNLLFCPTPRLPAIVTYPPLKSPFLGILCLSCSSHCQAMSAHIGLRQLLAGLAETEPQLLFLGKVWSFTVKPPPTCPRSAPPTPAPKLKPSMQQHSADMLTPFYVKKSRNAVSLLRGLSTGPMGDSARINMEHGSANASGQAARKQPPWELAGLRSHVAAQCLASEIPLLSGLPLRLEIQRQACSNQSYIICMLNF